LCVVTHLAEAQKLKSLEEVLKVTVTLEAIETVFPNCEVM
jgi:hypothetical protein